MFKKKLLKTLVSTTMAFVLATTPMISSNPNLTAIAAEADSNGFVEETESATTNEVQSKVILNTNYLDFKISTSAGSYAIVENGEKIEGDLEIEEPDLMNAPGEEIKANYVLPN